MFDQIFLAITILFSIIGFWAAIKAFKKKKYKISLLLIVLCGFLLRFYAGSDLFLHKWDERYHALVAKNLIQHPLKPTLYDNPVLPYDYKNWTANHIWLHKQPVSLWLMALSMKFFGINEIALRLPSILFSTLAIFFTFYISSWLFNIKTGLLASFFHSMSGPVIGAASGRVATDHIDNFFLFFIELAIFFAILYLQKSNRFINVLIGISIGLAVLTKWLPALIVIPIWFFLVLDKDKPKDIIINFFIIWVTCLMIFLPWQIYIYNHFPLESHWESELNLRHITEVIEEHKGGVLHHFYYANILWGELIYVPLIWFFYILFKNISNNKLIAIGIWFLVPYLFFTIVKTKMAGYVLFTAPSIFIISSYFWWHLKDNLNKVRLKYLAIAILALLILLPIRHTINHLSPFSAKKTIFKFVKLPGINRNPPWAIQLKRLNKIIKDSNAVLFNIEHSIEAMFYSSHTVYSNLPTNEQIDMLIKKGYNIYIYDDGKIPIYLSMNRSISFFKFN